MPFPDYESLADALLCFIYLNGGSRYEVRADSTYEPLADHFSLSQEERTRPRPDGYPGRDWHNHVQWARRRLINNGLAEEKRIRGLWELSAQGALRARSSVNKYEDLREG